MKGSTTTTTCVLLAIVATTLGAVEGRRNVRGRSTHDDRPKTHVPTSFFDATTSHSSSSSRRRRPGSKSRSTRRRKGRDDKVASLGSPPTAKDEYARECMSYLLSPKSIEDGMISQYDLVDMLLTVCRFHGPCLDDNDHAHDLTFDTLDVDLQLSFIEVVCPPIEGKFDCVLDLYGTWLDYGIFGFVIAYDDDDDDDDDDHRSLDDVVRETCVATYPHAVEMGLATSDAPTAAPSPSPSYDDAGMHPSFSPHAPTSEVPSRRPSARTPSPSSITSTPSISTTTMPSSSDVPSTTPLDHGERSDPPSATTSAMPSIPTVVVPLAPSSSPSSTSDIVIGTSSALAMLLAASCILYARHRRTAACTGYPTFASKDTPLGGERGETNRLAGTAVHEPWGKYQYASTSLPMSYMGLNCSSGSSSSSFRDYRFVAVFDPEGTPIPQFNPNTAGAVIIGSVTIGADSSLGSGPFADVGSSSIMSRSFFSMGTTSRRRGGLTRSEGGISSRDDVSSLSSRRSPKRANTNTNHYRSMDRWGEGKGSFWLDRRKRISKWKDPIGPSSKSSRSETSRNTVPMSHRKLQTSEGRSDGDRQVSFGDWMAISNITEFRHLGSFTDAAAMISQRKVFFNALCPGSIPSSAGLSLPDTYRVERYDGSSDAGGSSLSESYFQDAQQPTSPRQLSLKTSTESVSNSHAFVPWRKEGFSPSLQLSDDKQSNETATSSEESNPPDARKRLEFFRPAKAVLVKFAKRTTAKDWFSFKKRQYHYLRREHCIEDDSEVLSMNSYSSHVNLLPVKAASRANLPNLVLGTFAAATMPIGKQKAFSSQLIVAPSENDDGLGELVASLANGDAQIISSQSEHVIHHISSLDVDVRPNETDSESFSAYSRSDFESSAPSSSDLSSSVPSSSMPSKIGDDWSDSSCNHSSLTSQSNPCAFEIANSPLVPFVDSQNDITPITEVVEDFVDPTADDALKNASHQLSLNEPSFMNSVSQDFQNETNIVSRSGSDSDDAMFTLDEENSGCLAVNLDPNRLLKSSRSMIDDREDESVLLEGGVHLVDE